MTLSNYSKRTIMEQSDNSCAQHHEIQHLLTALD